MTTYTRQELLAVVKQAKHDAGFRIVLDWALLIDRSCTTLAVTGQTRDGYTRSINIAL